MGKTREEYLLREMKLGKLMWWRLGSCSNLVCGIFVVRIETRVK